MSESESIQYTMINICYLICQALLILLLVIGSASCSQKQTAHNHTTTSATRYIIMEKVLSDTPRRLRTTMKILIPDGKSKQEVSAALEKALADSRRDDPSLTAVIIWDYRTRSELNGSNFTLGKLEWSADGKDFDGQAPMSPNPKIDSLVP